MSKLYPIPPLFTLLLVGCSASSGLGSCSESSQIPFEATSTNVVQKGAMAALTQEGIEFFKDNREQLVGLVLRVDQDGWAQFDLPQLETMESDLITRTRDLVMGLNIRTAEVELDILSDPLRLDLVLRNARLRIDRGSIEIQAGSQSGVCNLSNGLEVGTVNESVTSIDARIVVAPRITVDGRIDATVTIDPNQLQIEKPSIIFTSDQNDPSCRNGGCSFVCDTTDLLVQLVESLYDRLNDTLGDTLAPILEDSIRENLDELAKDRILVDGEILAGRDADSVFPKDSLPLRYRIAPSSNGLNYVNTNGSPGIGLAIDVGADGLNHPCVPSNAQDRIFSTGTPPRLSELTPPNGPYHVGMMVSQASINRFIWSAWRTGIFCLHLDTEKLAFLTERTVDTSTLSVFFASIGVLSPNPSPIMLVLNPQIPVETFPIVRLLQARMNGQIPEVGAQLELSNLGIDIYAQIAGTWSRLLGVSASLRLDLTLQVDNGKKLIVNVESPQLDGIQIGYTELLEADNVPKLLEVFLDLAVSGLTDSAFEFDFSLDGALSMATNLPYELSIAHLNVAGDLKDYLGIALRLDRQTSTMGLTASVDTRAQIIGSKEDVLTVSVSSLGAKKPAYQWRIDNGPWRRLRQAINGQLTIKEPRFRLDTPQDLYIRSIDLMRSDSLDYRPVHLTVPGLKARRDTSPASTQNEDTEVSGGCSTVNGKGDSSGLLALIIILGLLGLRRSRNRLPQALLCLLVFGLGCSNDDPSSDLICSLDRDCPTDRVCIDDRCELSRPCDDDGACCGSQVCRDKVCESQPTDGCTLSSVPCGAHEICVEDTCLATPCASQMDCKSGASCVEGSCMAGQICGGLCDANQACWITRNQCKTAPKSCAQTCDIGQTRVIINAREFDGPQCGPDTLQCRCVDSLPISSRTVTGQTDISLHENSLSAAVYDPRFGDLVFMYDIIREPNERLILDGLEALGDMAKKPDSSRMGQINGGPNRGQFPQISHDSKGRIHITYFDADLGDVRYVRRSEDGEWSQPMIIDSDGYAGHGLKMEIDESDHLHLVYAVTSRDGLMDAIRYAYGPPSATVSADFVVLRVSESQTDQAQPDSNPSSKSRFSLYPCLALGNGQTFIGFHDDIQSTFYLAVGGPGGFQVTPVVGGLSLQSPSANDPRYLEISSHDIGDQCALGWSNDRVIGLATDRQTWSLLSFSQVDTNPAVFDIVDSGGVGERRIVGDSPVLKLLGMNRYLAVYRDGTNNDLRLNIFDGSRWNPIPQVLLSNGAVGFSNSVAVSETTVFVSTVELSTATGNRETSDIRILDIPRTNL